MKNFSTANDLRLLVRESNFSKPSVCDDFCKAVQKIQPAIFDWTNGKSFGKSLRFFYKHPTFSP